MNVNDIQFSEKKFECVCKVSLSTAAPANLENHFLRFFDFVEVDADDLGGRPRDLLAG